MYVLCCVVDYLAYAQGHCCNILFVNHCNGYTACICEHFKLDGEQSLSDYNTGNHTILIYTIYFHDVLKFPHVNELEFLHWSVCNYHNAYFSFSGGYSYAMSDAEH